ncbi:MAG: AAA family ATPase [Lachnospiraceae bacterium]|nr:AAA family ATPase [Lachnospiraceae bacterium]
METSARLNQLLIDTVDTAKKWRHEYVTPEHFLYTLTKDEAFIESYEACGGDAAELKKKLKRFFKKNMEQMPEKGVTYITSLSNAFQAMLEYGAQQADSSGRRELKLTHVFFALMKLPECYATYLMAEQNVNVNDVFFELCYLEEENEDPSERGTVDKYGEAVWEDEGSANSSDFYDEDEDYGGFPYEGASRRTKSKGWREYVTNLNEFVESPSYTKLVGREDEIRRTMLILCRKDKNNPLHIGEPGVGKTAITYGLVRKIVEDEVPDALKGATVYSIDMGSMVAGTQYRGDFEKRMKMVLEGINAEEKPIVYLDEIHNVIGAGSVSSGSLDASNILKPYLADGHIRFIGATTYDEYKKHFEKSKSMVRRFQNVDIKEPTEEETVEILEGVRSYYEEYHKVVYSKEILNYIVALSNKYINERFLPDKAIDLLDESGAVISMRGDKERTVTKDLVEEVLSEFLKIPKQNVTDDEAESLKNLDSDLKSKVFGQTEAIDSICKAIRISRAGLNEENKPVASLLFVGPTGVGKTEIARTLADSLGISLVRFDMSEFMEKHSVAKFIGAPAGYVGYEEGGRLTDAIRKHPHSVLLLDEIEKAHPDIFNVLLQVMDYATLSDNQGRRADFRNVIIIMTSNAGAARLGKPTIGFGDSSLNLGAIDEEVKRIFSPEFRNRLTSVVTFNGLSEDMSRRIVDKELNILSEQLNKRGVLISFTDELKGFILNKGVTTEYGARELQRVIDRELKPVLVDALLYGSLKGGGNATLDFADGKVILKEKGDW